MQRPHRTPLSRSLFSGCAGSDGTVDDLFTVRVPVKFPAAPVGLGRHDAHQCMREAMIDSGVRLRACLHRLKPVHQMTYVVIVRPRGGRRRRPRNMHDLLTVLCGSHDGELSVYRPGVERIKFLPASFAGNRKQGSTLTSIVLDGAVASVNSGKAPIAVAEDRLVGVEKSLWIDDGRDAGIGIVPSIFPGEDAPVGNDTFRIRLIRPKMHHVAAVAEPLIEDAGGKVFI